LPINRDFVIFKPIFIHDTSFLAGFWPVFVEISTIICWCKAKEHQFNVDKLLKNCIRLITHFVLLVVPRVGRIIIKE
jgi:hypothetical protein